MKSVQSTSPGFVLTSLSFQASESKKNLLQTNQQYVASHKSSIAKFDYCLPPDDINAAAETGFGINAR
ncbi:MAG: hypothetical protein IPP72_08275 [Chitinophagaceae bacterium]|nr:hypothetical protein [Chitinophagaceae bacterium]